MDEGDGKKGWLLLRSSLHDPLLVLNVESDLPGGRFKERLHLLYSSFAAVLELEDYLSCTGRCP